MRVEISHWLPIITICPVNKLPDFLYATVVFEEGFHELYSVRRRIKKVASWRYCFMEDIATDLLAEFPDAAEVKIKLLTGRHVIVAKP